MAEYRGSLTVPEDGSRLPAVVRVADGRLTLAANDHDVGAWGLEEISLVLSNGGVILGAEGETLVLSLDDTTRFAQEAGIVKPGTAEKKRLRRAKPDNPEKRAKRVQDETQERRSAADVVASLRSNRLALAGAALVALVAITVFVPGLVAAVAIVVGGLAVVVGGLAIAEPLLSLKFPDAWTPFRLITLGAALLALGLVIDLLL